MSADSTRSGRVGFHFLASVALLAGVYWLTGKLGLALAIPPGYATVIWPPSGIAMAVLLVYGSRLAPGIFIGSFVLNLTTGHVPAGSLQELNAFALAACVALGSTLQALSGRALIVRFFGMPVRLVNATDVLRVLAVAAPFTCVLSASVGVAALHFFAGVHASNLPWNWFTWWAGDVFGVLVFLPLIVVLPRGGSAVSWRGHAVRSVHAISLTLLVLPLGITFYGWKLVGQSTYRQSQAHFEALARENEQALNARLATYASATRSGAGIFQSSDYVSPEEWRTFVETLQLREDYPGLLGLGWIEHVSDGNDIVKYFEPEPMIALTAGRNVARLPAVYEAATRAVTDGEPTLTSAMRFAQDLSPVGFLLLQPVYRTGAPLGTSDLRMRALRGYVYAPFLARGLTAKLTPSEGRSLDITLLEGDGHGGEPVFSGRHTQDDAGFSLRRQDRMFGRQWTVLWQSTSAFEQAEHSDSAFFVLFGGLLFTGMFALLLLVIGARPESEDPASPLEKPGILPLATLVVLVGGSVTAYSLLVAAEHANITSLVDGEARRVDANLSRLVRARLQALGRMSHRWTAASGTPYDVWRSDARDYVRQVDGLEEIQWIGPDYRVQWAEGARRSSWSEDSEFKADPTLAQALEVSVARGAPLVTEPRVTSPGESAFAVYLPLVRDGKFDGFLVGRFSSRGFFSEALDVYSGGAYAFSLRYGNSTFFDNGESAAAEPQWRRQIRFPIGDREWIFELSPTQGFVASKRTLLPLIVLVAGVLIAILSAILVRFVLVSRLKAVRLLTSARALAESERRYELALRGMSVGVWDWDIESGQLITSARAQEILGIKPGNAGNRYEHFTARLHPDDRATVERTLAGHLRGMNPYDLEFRMRRDDGTYLWVHSCGQAQFAEDGRALRIAGSVQDISQKHQHQEEIERTGAQLRLLVENAPVAIAMFDTDMRYIMTSQRWLHDYQLEGRNIIGLSHYDVFPWIRAMPGWVAVHQRALRGEEFDVQEDSYVRADGVREWNQWAIHPWLEPSGKVGGIVMFTESITPRKSAEAALQRSEAMNRAAMDKSPIGNALVLPSGRFIKVNPALCQLLGYTEQELLAKDFQSVTYPDDVAEVEAKLRFLLEGKTVSFQAEKRCIHRDGRLIWTHDSVSLVRRAGGEPDFLVAHIQEISVPDVARRGAEDPVGALGQALREPLAAMADALTRIAAIREAEQGSPLREFLDSCQDNCERLTTLASAFQDLEKIAAGNMPFNFHDESIAEVTRQVVRQNEAVARRHGLELKLGDIDADTVVFIDPNRYADALTHLLSNAMNFSPVGSVIEVSAQTHDEWIRIGVRDQGVGIPEEFRPRIFGKFSRAESKVARRKPGVGLGLYLARQIVERMQGRIGFATQLGSGTTFWIEFPRVLRSDRRQRANESSGAS